MKKYIDNQSLRWTFVSLVLVASIIVYSGVYPFLDHGLSLLSKVFAAFYLYKAAKEGRLPSLLWPVLGYFAILFFISLFNHIGFNTSVSYIIKITGVYCFLSVNLAKDKQKTLRSIGVAFYILLFVNFILYFYNPEGLINVNRDFFIGGNYNQFGASILLAFLINILAVGKSRKEQIYLFSLFLIGFLSVAMPGSSTSLIGLTLFCLAAMCLKENKIRTFVIGLVVVALIFFTVFVLPAAASETDSFFGKYILPILGKNTTFSGRVVIWSDSMSIIKNSPWFGYGAVEYEWYKKHIFAASPHNSILFFLIQGGVVLLAYVVGLIVYAFYIRRKNNGLVVSKSFAVIAGAVFLLMGQMELYMRPLYFILLYIIAYEPLFSERKNRENLPPPRLKPTAMARLQVKVDQSTHNSLSEY